MGLLATPPAAYYLARSMRLGKHISLVAAGAGVVFAFFESYSIYGGNIASTLAGEFAYSWSFALSLLYLGLLIRAVRDDRRYLKWAAVALAATALSHVLTTIVVIFASLFVLPWRKGFWRTLAIWLWGFAIAAFWALPLIARIGFSSDMSWTPLSRWEEIFPVELWLLLPLAIPGAVWISRRTSWAAPLLAATILPVLYFPLPHIMPELFPTVFGGERWKLWNGRLLPYWYFRGCLLRRGRRRGRHHLAVETVALPDLGVLAAGIDCRHHGGCRLVGRRFDRIPGMGGDPGRRGRGSDHRAHVPMGVEPLHPRRSSPGPRFPSWFLALSPV